MRECSRAEAERGVMDDVDGGKKTKCKVARYFTYRISTYVRGERATFSPS